MYIYDKKYMKIKCLKVDKKNRFIYFVLEGFFVNY